MGHCISVYLIKKSEVRNEKIDTVIDGVELNKILWVELEEGILATTHIPNIKEYGANKTIARITTDYFGGDGYQTAQLFVNNEKVYDKTSEKTHCNPINDVLKLMGVKYRNESDEFNTVGLENYRDNSDFDKN